MTAVAGGTPPGAPADLAAPLLPDAAPPPERGRILGPLGRLGLFLLLVLAARVLGDLLSWFALGTLPDAAAVSLLSLTTWRGLLSVVPGVAAMDLCYRWAVRRFERRRPAELLGPRLGRELGAGILCGGLLLSSLVAGLAIAGCYTIIGHHAWTSTLPALALSLNSGYGEELLARGVLLRLLEEAFGSGAALAISALAFGFLHIFNPHSTALSTASITAAGLLLGGAYLLTRRLWLAIGLHLAWNYTQAGVFGIAVSGHSLGGWLVGRLSCATVWSGGPFGVEGSVFAVALCSVSAAVLVTIARRRGHLLSGRLLGWRPRP